MKLSKNHQISKNFFLVDPNSSFSVILRPNESPISSNHDQLSLQRYATHPATRLVSRHDSTLLSQQQQQVVSPTSVFFQHSPSASENENQNVDAEGSSTGGNSGNGSKYGECPSNGHDTLSDFVTFVCQESEQSNGNRHSPKSQQYTQYNTMLPPPPLPAVTGPLPPMAVPVTSGYSGRF